MLEQEPLDRRLLNEEEPPNAKLIPFRMSFWFAWLFWFVALCIGASGAMVFPGITFLGEFPTPLYVLACILVAMLVSLLLALATIWSQAHDIRRFQRKKEKGAKKAPFLFRWLFFFVFLCIAVCLILVVLHFGIIQGP